MKRPDLRRQRVPLTALLISVVLGTTACDTTKTLGSGTVSMPAEWAGAPGAAGTATDTTVPQRWWTLYQDATLDGLVTQALGANADLALAIAQLDEAEGVLREAGANLYPQVNLGATALRTHVSTVTATPPPPSYPIVRNDRMLTAGTAYELDFFGRVRGARDAARAQLLASRFATDVVRLSVAGSVVQGYLALRSTDAQLDVMTATLASREASLAVVRSRARGGLSSDLDLRQAESALADAAAQLIELKRQRHALEHALGQLAGRPDLRLASASFDAIPMAPVPPAGLPSALLLRRPDVQAAEQQLAAADARLDIARKAYFPTITLTGSFGTESAALADLMTAPGRIWSMALGVTQPIFDAGRIASRIDQADARRRQALAGYTKAAQTAYRETADALTNLANASETEAELRRAQAAAAEALRLATLRYEAGYSPYLDVLDAQRTQNATQLAAVRARQARFAYGVDLMKALGGGWHAPTP